MKKTRQRNGKQQSGFWRVSLVIGFTIFAAARAPGQDSAVAEGAEVILGPGDRVQVTVFGHEDLSGELEIDARGRLSLPLGSAVVAQGLTIDELESAIVDSLRPDYLVDPRVTAQLVSLRPFYILGEVNAPGSYPYASDMTIMKAVAIAGGFTPRARSKRVVIRRVVDGEETEVAAEDETVVRPGDVIEVPERFF